MRIYYEGPGAVVTSELFIRRGTPPGTFAIGELHNVCIAPDRADRTGHGIAASAALIAAVVVYAVGGPWVALVLLITGALASITGAMVGWRRRPRRHELRADYRGASVALFSSTDARVFNQVRRALMRAVENLPPPASWHDRKAA